MSQETNQAKSLGELRVRTQFNPSADSMVDQIKQKTAELINLLQSVRNNEMSDGEILRLISLAQTSYEEAAMWGVKAVTG